MNRLLLIVILLCMTAFTESVQACECSEYGTPIGALFWRSDAVFIGQVVDIKPLKNQRIKIPQGDSAALKLVIQRIKK